MQKIVLAPESTIGVKARVLTDTSEKMIFSFQNESMPRDMNMCESCPHLE